jgi:hypothetical protein
MSKITENDIIDKRGNVLVSQGLKVRHKDSRFEYTVDSVAKDRSGNIVILLRNPEEPRVPARGAKSSSPLTDMPSTAKSTPKSSKIIYDVDLRKNFSDSYYEPEEEEPPSPEDLIVVSRKKFEKEYEVV